MLLPYPGSDAASQDSLNGAAWYGNITNLDCMALQRVVRTAQYITGVELPAIQDLYIIKHLQSKIKSRIGFLFRQKKPPSLMLLNIPS
jgi:hypothetical protein